VLLTRPVEGGGDHLALDRALDVGDLLGPLVDEQHDQLDLGVVELDHLGDRLHHRGLAGLRGRDQQPALALADRADEIDDPGGHVARVAGILEGQLLVGEERGEVLEPRPLLGRFGVATVDGVDLEQGRVLLVALRRAHLPTEVVALAQTELTGQLERDVGVLLARQVAVDPQEPVALVAHVEVALDVDRLVALRLLVLEQLGVLALRTFLPAAVLAATAPTTAVALALLVLVVLALLVALVLAALALVLVLATLALVAALALAVLPLVVLALVALTLVALTLVVRALVVVPTLVVLAVVARLTPVAALRAVVVAAVLLVALAGSPARGRIVGHLGDRGVDALRREGDLPVGEWLAVGSGRRVVG